MVRPRDDRSPEGQVGRWRVREIPVQVIRRAERDDVTTQPLEKITLAAGGRSGTGREGELIGGEELGSPRAR